MMADKIIVVGIAFALGVLVASFLTDSVSLILLGFLLSTVVYVGHLVTREVSQRQLLLMAVIILLALTFGLLRTFLANRSIDQATTNVPVGVEQDFTGVITAEPDERENNVRLKIKLDDYPVSIIATADFYPVFNYGDQVILSGELDWPEKFTTDTGREFDYVSYLRKDGVSFLMYRPQIELVESGHGSWVVGKLFKLKNSFMSRLTGVLPEPQASLAGGLLLGLRRTLGNEVEDQFRLVGLIHIIVLSGYNITIVADSLMRTTRKWFPKASLVLGAVGIVLFAILVGGGATVIRASIMALLVLLARWTNRPYGINRALIIAGVAMLIHNPLILAHDPSFQLSFLATLGLLFVSPIVIRYLSWLPTKWQLRETVTTTLATQIFVLPFLLYLTGAISLVTLPANILVLGAIPTTMFMSFITGLLGFISPVLAWPFGAVSYLLLSYELLVAKLFASLPLASFTVKTFPFWLVVIIYGSYIWVIRKFSQTKKIDKVV